MKIPQEIRSKINQLDEIAGNILEWMEDNDFRDTDDQGDEDLMNELESLQNEITTFQESKGWLDYHPKSKGWLEDDAQYKDYSEVEIGDKAYHCDTPNLYLGRILWTGSFEELQKSEYRGLISDWDDDEKLGILYYDIVVLNDGGFSILFTYNGDPWGCIVKRGNQE